VHEHNPWVAYGEALHRAREWGGAPQVLDWLDERPLAVADAQRLVEHLLGPFQVWNCLNGETLKISAAQARACLSFPLPLYNLHVMDSGPNKQKQASLQLDPDGFLREHDGKLGGQADVFDADANRCRPWVDRRGLARHVLKRGPDVLDICSCAVA
jgi:hypothetical protein